MILGLDLSTSMTGVTVLDASGEVVYCEAWDTRNKNKFPTFFDKIDYVRHQLRYLGETRRYKIDHIFIEQSLQAFRPGFSSAKTILTLAKFNGIVSYICRREFRVEPRYIGASTARKLCGVKIEKGKKAKPAVLQFVLDTEADFEIEYTKQGNPKPGAYDKADSYIIAKAGWKSLKS